MESELTSSHAPHYLAALLILQLSCIILLTWIGSVLGKKLKIPEVISFLIMGIIFGPYVLGAIPLAPVLPEGLFPFSEGEPVSHNLFALSTIASVVLLFCSGLQSDIELFKKYAVRGSIIGIFAVIVSFLGGYFVSIFFFPHLSLFHPTHLFLGTITTATSVGISSALLSNKDMISSPEGVTILSAAVLDDVIGIILLSIVIGIADQLKRSTVEALSILNTIAITSVKAIGIWLFFTVLSMLFSRKLGNRLKNLHEPTLITIIALAIGFFLGYVFEVFNLSVIVGAFVVGLALSNTDISHLLQERIYPIYKFFIPIFFFVSGMYINIQVIFELDILLFGLLFSAVGISAKFLGAGIPAYFTGFNLRGSARIGMGMVPRGEVSLIIAGLGRSAGILDDRIFSTTLIMIFITSTVSPLIFDWLLDPQKKGTKKDIEDSTVRTQFEFERTKLAKFILSELLQLFQTDGFFVTSTRRKHHTIVHIRKNETFITLHYQEANTLTFNSEEYSIPIIRTAVYESVSNIADTTNLIQHALDPKKMITQTSEPPPSTKKHSKGDSISLTSFLDIQQIVLALKSNEKKAVLQELVNYLRIDENFTEENRAAFLEDIYEREATLTTGLEKGIAIPHARSPSVKNTKIVVGLHPEGLDFSALDGKPSHIFVLIASPQEGPHLEILAKITTLLQSKKNRETLIQAKTREEVLACFSK